MELAKIVFKLKTINYKILQKEWLINFSKKISKSSLRTIEVRLKRLNVKLIIKPKNIPNKN